MAQVCEGDCARAALGLLSQAEFVAEFGASCVESAGRLYCVNGVPSTPPEKKMSRTETTFDNAPTLSSAQIQSIGPNNARVDNVGMRNITNASCFDVELWAQASTHQIITLGHTGGESVFITVEWRISLNGFVSVPVLHDQLNTTTSLSGAFPMHLTTDSRASGPWVRFGILAAKAAASMSLSRSVSIGGPVTPTNATVASNIQNIVHVDMIPV